MDTFNCLIINSSTDKSARQNDLIANLKRYLPIQIFRYIYVCQWLWLGSQQPSAEFNCSLPPGPGPVSTAQILCQQSLFVECGLGIRRYVAAGAPPNITTLGFMPSNSNMTNGVRPPCAMCDKLHFFQHLAKKLQSCALTSIVRSTFHNTTARLGDTSEHDWEIGHI